MKNKRPETLREVSELVRSGEKLQICIGNFLDGFYAGPREQALRDEPWSVNRDTDVFLAAVAEDLANRFDLSVPAWCEDPSKVIEPPQFPTKNPAYQKALWDECPEAFKRRGLVVSANALSRS